MAKKRKAKASKSKAKKNRRAKAWSAAVERTKAPYSSRGLLPVVDLR